MMGKKWDIKYLAVLTIVMFFGCGIASVFAEIPTSDQTAESEKAEDQSTESHEDTNEDMKKGFNDKAQDERGYGPLSSPDLYGNLIDDVLNGRFGQNWSSLLGKFGEAVAKEQLLKKTQRKEIYMRKKAVREKLHEEDEKKQKAEEEIATGREAEAPKKKKWWKKKYDWYKSNEVAQEAAKSTKEYLKSIR